MSKLGLTEFLGPPPEGWGGLTPGLPAFGLTEGARLSLLPAKQRRSAHPRSQAHENETNSNIENTNQQILKVTRTILVASRMPVTLWHLAMPFAATVMNIGECDEDSPWRKRFGSEFPANI